MNEKFFVTYEQFGAIGDGKTDDIEAIAKAHAYANEHRLPVKAKDDATYYIGGKCCPVTVKTSTDFGKAHFIIDDRACEAHNKHIFYVTSDCEYYPVKIDKLDKGQKKIDIPHEGNIFVKVRNENKRVYIRYGANQNNGSALIDYFTVDKDGNIGTLMAWQFDEVTEAWAKSTDEEPIRIEGGTFTTIANLDPFEKRRYHSRAFSCKRSHVHFRNITHLITGEPEPEEHYSSPYAGFLCIEDCYDVTVENVTFTPHRTYHFTMANGVINAIGTYEMNGGGTIGLKLIGLRQTIDIQDSRYWGLMGTNFCKDMLLEDCKISRFDAHCGVHNVTMRGCEFGHVTMEVIGFGNFLYENGINHGSRFFLLRGDYGSFFKGDVTIRHAVWDAIPNSVNGKSFFFNASNGGTHDFGYTCEMPRHILLEDVLIDDSRIGEGHEEPCLFNAYCKTLDCERPFPYGLPETITLKNVRTKSGKPVKIFADASLFEGVKVIIED